MIELQLGRYRIAVATDFGPRVMSLRWDDGPELLATLGEESVIEHAGGIYRFRGGHRLWASPEVASITYANDDHPCIVDPTDGRVVISAPADAAEVMKKIAVEPAGDGLLVKHSLTRPSTSPAGLGAWAITQFPPGGVAFLPLRGEATGPMPNRQLVLWPYTSLADDRLEFHSNCVRIHADGGSDLKLGSGPATGRVGYFRSGHLFTKEVVDASLGGVADLGANVQVFVGPSFCELETMSGLVGSDNEVAHLTELWTVTVCADVGAAEELTLKGSGL